MVKYLPIHHCIYCHHRQLKKREGEKYKSDPHCYYDKDRPRKIDSRGDFNFTVPWWCPLPTAWELLQRLLGGRVL